MAGPVVGQRVVGPGVVEAAAVIPPEEKRLAPGRVIDHGMIVADGGRIGWIEVGPAVCHRVVGPGVGEPVAAPREEEHLAPGRVVDNGVAVAGGGRIGWVEVGPSVGHRNVGPGVVIVIASEPPEEEHLTPGGVVNHGVAPTGGGRIGWVEVGPSVGHRVVGPGVIKVAATAEPPEENHFPPGGVVDHGVTSSDGGRIGWVEVGPAVDQRVVGPGVVEVTTVVPPPKEEYLSPGGVVDHGVMSSGGGRIGWVEVGPSVGHRVVGPGVFAVAPAVVEPPKEECLPPGGVVDHGVAVAGGGRNPKFLPGVSAVVQHRTSSYFLKRWQCILCPGDRQILYRRIHRLSSQDIRSDYLTFGRNPECLHASSLGARESG